jgi:hypothetical protein
VVVRPVVVRREEAPEEGFDAQHREELSGYELSRHFHGIAGAREREVERRGRCGEVRERVVHLPPVDEVAWRYGVGHPVAREVAFPNDRETIGIVVGQALEEHRVHDAEDRRIRPDTDRERADGHRREARRAPEQAGTVPQVLGDA